MSGQVCLICQTTEAKNIATFYCKTCDPPRPLCDECARRHRKHLRGHQIDEVMPLRISKMFPSGDEKLDNKNLDHLCFLCLRVNKRSAATSVCNDCDNLKAMCDDCAYQHTRQKMTRDHKIRRGITASDTTTENYARNEMNDASHEEEEYFSNDDEHPQISVPGEPKAMNCEDNRVELKWSMLDDNVDSFRIRFRKVEDEMTDWTEINTPYTDDCTATITNLMPDTQYCFQVKGILDGKEGDYSLLSEPILTNPSLAQKMCAHCTTLSGMNPKVFELPARIIPGTEDKNLKVRKVLLGGHFKSKSTTYERTILFLGKTGSGKSTMIDAFINYILGVNFDDMFRFTANTEKKSVRDKWLTVYTMQPFDGSRITYILNFIDIPGFEKDNNENKSILNQMSFLLSSDGKIGAKYLDCVCIIVKEKDLLDAPKLERSFQTMLSHIGKDLEANICILTTFSAAKALPALTSFSDHQFPLLGIFNNSILFADNLQEQTKQELLSQWGVGWKSFKRFFDHFESLTRKSVDITRDLLFEREQIELHLYEMKEDIASIFKVTVEHEEKTKILNRQKEILELCKDFKYEMKQSKVERHEIANGHHSVYCPSCQKTCKEDCNCTVSSSTAECPITGSSNNCTVCIDNCPLAFHAKLNLNLKHVEETVETTNEKLKNVFDKVSNMNKSIEQEISDLSTKINEKHERFLNLMKTVAKFKNKSEKNSLYPYQKPVDWPIVQIIEAEETLKHEGYQNRIEVAKELQEKLKKFCGLKHVLN